MPRPTFPAAGVTYTLKNDDLRAIMDYAEEVAGGLNFAPADEQPAGLLWAWKAGQYTNEDGEVVDVAAGQIALADDATNYIFLSPAGVVGKNTTGFDGTHKAIREVTTADGSVGTEAEDSIDRRIDFDFRGGSGNGEPGTPGSVWHQVTTEPAVELGVDGDWAFNASTGDVYHKEDGAWVFQIKLEGPPGTPGLALNWLGDNWLTATAYEENDALAHGDPASSYRCHTAHTSSATDEPGVGVSWTAFWGYVAQAGDTGAAGAAGTAGTNGTLIYNGTGVPSDGAGANGDWYFRTATADFYKKIAGAWAIQFNTRAVGVPTGGTAGQPLEKVDGTNYNTTWGTVKAEKIIPTPGLTTPVTTRKSSPNIDDFADQGINADDTDGFREGIVRNLEGRGDNHDDFVFERNDGNNNGDGGIAFRFVNNLSEVVNALYIRAQHIVARKPISFHKVASIDTPLAGQVAVGIKSDGKLYTRDESAAETTLATTADVDAARAGLSIKDPVRAATTANIVLSGTQTIDGVAVIADDRVLVKNQTAGEENGIYVVAAGAWSRATDANVSAEAVAGMACWVNEGTANGDKRFALTTNNPIVLGTTALVFTQDSAITPGASAFTNLTDVPSAYTGHAGKVATVKGDESGLEFTTPSSGSSASDTRDAWLFG